MKKIVLVLLLILGLTSISAAATLDVYAAYVSRYMWRGCDSNFGQPSLQPGITWYIGNTGINLGLWGSYNLGNINPQDLNEIDYTLTYNGSYGSAVSYSLAYSYYYYPDQHAPKTAELIGNLTLNEVIFTPNLLVAYDGDNGKGTYTSLGAKNNFSAGALALNASLVAGYDMGQYGLPAGWSDINLAVSTAVNAGPVSITPSLNYVIINPDLMKNPLPNEGWIGVTASGSI